MGLQSLGTRSKSTTPLCGSTLRRQSLSTPRTFATTHWVLARCSARSPLERIRYEPAGWWSGFALGFSAGDAFRHRRRQSDPGLAERVGKWTAQYTQEIVRQRLHEEHQIAWSVTTLRKRWLRILSRIALPPLTPAKRKLNVCWGCCKRPTPARAWHRPVSSAGRDGIFVPISGRHQVPRSRDGYGGGIGSKWEAVGHGVFGSDARTRPRDVVSAIDRFVNRGSPALGRPIAPIAIRDRRRPSPKRILRQGVANHASSCAHRAVVRVGMGAGLLSCLSIHHEDRGSFCLVNRPNKPRRGRPRCVAG